MKLILARVAVLMLTAGVVMGIEHSNRPEEKAADVAVEIAGGAASLGKQKPVLPWPWLWPRE